MWKFLLKKELADLTSLTPLIRAGDNLNEYYAGGFYVSGLTESLAKILRGHSIILSPNSTGHKLKTHLGNTKDKVENYKKSGIYAALCADCDRVYIGQCCRSCELRFGEHYKPLYENLSGVSTAADHMIENDHDFAGFRLLKEVNKSSHLDTWENLFIYKTKSQNINIQHKPITSLYKFTVPLKTNSIFKSKF